MNEHEGQPAIDKAFLNVLSTHRAGIIISDVSSALKQATAAVQNTGKPAKVVLTMTLKPASQGAVGTLVFEPRIKTIIPETVPAGSIFYSDGDFNLVRNDPHVQTTMVLREVPVQQPQQLKEVA